MSIFRIPTQHVFDRMMNSKTAQFNLGGISKHLSRESSLLQFLPLSLKSLHNLLRKSKSQIRPLGKTSFCADYETYLSNEKYFENYYGRLILSYRNKEGDEHSITIRIPRTPKSKALAKEKITRLRKEISEAIEKIQGLK